MRHFSKDTHLALSNIQLHRALFWSKQ